ncbi:RHS repeat-associated core domain-containing protein [Hyalangium versicolor]|uniref:RHS repeat-associated core domain-containing protein n=1 Tax=Hyalangium versicolor TaxID=2861190 RepID=UPI001CCE74EE|nr:RHS repeat-associated core domain-containing protein [Hyalangium versicolor]
MVPVLLIVLAALPSTPPSSKEIDLTPPAPQVQVDMQALHERTRRFEQLRARHRAAEQHLAPTGSLETLSEARSLCSTPPGFWARLLPGGSDTPETLNSCRSAAERTEQLSSTLTDRRNAAMRHFDSVEALLGGSSQREEVWARLEKQRALLKERSADAEELAKRTSTALRGGGDSFSDRLSWHLLPSGGGDASELLSQFETQLRSWSGTEQPVLGADLTYVQGGAEAGSMPTARMTPAYLSLNSEPMLDDAAEGREVELSAELVTKAQELGTAKAAYDFVKNETRLDWYFGSLKGSTQTLRERRGNDADLSALLVALLRAQGTPARFVHGTVELSVEQIAASLGMLTGEEVAKLDAATSGGAAWTLSPEKSAQVVQALNAAAIPYEPVVRGGRVAAVNLVRIWVEAYVDFAEYRGVGNGKVGRQWVALETSLTGQAKAAATPPVLDALTALKETPDSLTAAWLSGPTQKSMVEFVRGRVESYLTAQHPDIFYSQMQWTVVPRKEELPLLPGSLPYKVLTVHGESAFLPESLQQQVQLTAWNDAGLLFELKLPLHQVTGHRTVLTHVPATETDAQIISLAGGLYAAPASLVEVRPVVRINGREMAVSGRSVGLGTSYQWSLEVLLPGGGTRHIDNRVVAGNVVAIGVGGPGNKHQETAGLDSADLDGPALRFLYTRAAAYANAWTQAEDELARLLQVIPVRPTANIVFVQNQVRVDEVLGVRRRLEWKGLEVDADFRAMTPVELKPGRGTALLRLSGYEGSFQEARVLSEGTGEPAVSSVSVLQEAAVQGIPILHLQPNGAVTGLQATPEVLNTVADQLERGRQVDIPATPLTLENWTGTGFISRDPVTEEGGYFLSGVVSGGQTIVSPELWTDAELAERLGRPDAPMATDDLEQVARIFKVAATDFQVGTVGKPLPYPLAVYVTTAEGVPVKGAPVTFETADASKPLFRSPKTPDAQPAGQLTVLTDETGRASVVALPDTKIGHLGVLEQGQPFLQVIGLNVVQAHVQTTTSAASLQEPFEFTARPDAVARFTRGQSTFISDVGVELGVPLTLTALDQYDNMLANQTVHWSSNPATAVFFDARDEFQPPRVQTLGSHPERQFPVLDQKTTMLGQGTVGFIPGMEPAAYTITASAGAASTQFTVQTTDINRYAFRVTYGNKATVSGILGTATPAPYFLELLQRANEDGTGNWVRMTGREPNIKSARIHMSIRDDASDRELSHETASPSQLGTGSMSGVDLADNVVFWPRYLVKNGRQLMQFTAEIEESNPEDEEQRKPCCTQEFSALVESREPGLAVNQLRADQSPAELNGCGAISSADGWLQFHINNPAGYPLYARIIPEPIVSGETLLEAPPADFLRDPVDGTSLVMVEQHLSRIPLKVRTGTHGGQVRLELFAPDFQVSDRLRTKVGEITTYLDFNTPGLSVSKEPLRAKLILAVRNFESAATPENPEDVVAPTATVKPIPVPARLRFCPSESGRVQVYSGQALLAAADVTEGQGPGLVLSPIQEEVPVPAQPEPGLLLVSVPPGDPAGQEVRVDFARASTPTEHQEQKLELRTRITDTSVLPVGHTFVKDVSTVDGHLVRQVVDLEVPGRRPALQFSRSYTNRGNEPGVLGRGWSHGYSGHVIASEDPEQNIFRYMVVGGEGAGQVFDCGPEQTACKAQQGFHGTFRGETVGSGASAHRELVFRAQDGTEYRYGSEVSTEEGVSHPLLSIRSPEGNVMVFEYGGPELHDELLRVWEPGNRRFLQFSYAQPDGAPRLQLSQVGLYENPMAPTRLLPKDEGSSLGVCIGFRYNAMWDLSGAARYDGPCLTGDDAAPLREEHYGYVGGPDDELQTNLVSWTDANGHTTQYQYYGRSDSLPGEQDFLRFGDKQERVRRVIEPLDVVTEFTYRLVPRALPVFGQTMLTFETEVKGPRPEVPPTFYRMDPYGGMVDVERPVEPMLFAHTSAKWDRVHMRRDAEQDARGRVVKMKYDELGRLIERRTDLSVLPASGDAEATEPVKDAEGQVLDEAVEKWSYDIAFGALVCQMDAEGRITVHTLDTDGKDPRTGLPVGTGLLLESRRLATPVSREQARSTDTCAELAAPLPRTNKDIITHREYCHVRSTDACPPGAVTGDLTATVDGNINRSAITAYDPYGSVREQTVAVTGSKTVKTTREFDARGRLKTESDTFGHRTLQEYDGLDRPKTVIRANTKGLSPSVVKQLEYYAGGQLRREYTPSTGFERLYTLDELNRVKTVKESGGGLESPLVTEYGYDKAGNRETVTDRRGVKTTTEYDLGDRPVLVRIAPAEGNTFLLQNGVEGIVGQAGVVATYGYDTAGNRLFETDIHGHQTDYRLDSLYRVVRAQGPMVPGPELDAPPRRYETLARFDLVGNKTLSVDGNEHETIQEYDFANRLVSTKDAVEREERREYDFNGNPTLEKWLAGGIEQRRRTTQYDGLNRPFEVTETFKRVGNETSTLITTTAYADEQNALSTKDARGFLTVVIKDDLDRVYQQTVDAAAEPSHTLTRQPDDPLVGSALELLTRFEYDPHGNLAVQVDALNRRTEETHDALGRLSKRNKPMGVTESFVYDGEGHTLQQTDGRGIVRTTGYDVAGRPALEQLVESLSNGGEPLTTLERFYLDTPEADSGLVKVVEQDARLAQTVHVQDGMHREVRVEDALNHVRESRFDAQNLRVSRDAKGYTTRYDYDAVGRLKAQRDFELNQSTARYTQTSTYDDASRTETLVDRREIPTVRLRDGLGRLMSETRGLGDDVRSESTTYNAAGQVVARIDPNNHTSRYRYDAAGQMQTETRGAGTQDEATTTHTYDAVGNLISTLGPRNPGKPYTNRWTYDDLNRQVRSEDALERVTASAYDAAGNLLCVKRPLGHPTLGHGQATGLTVEQLRNQVCTGTHVTRYTYDEVGKLTDTIDALDGHYSFVYDATRNLVAKQDANGNLSTFEFDELGHRTAEHVHLDAHRRQTAVDRASVPLFEPGAEPLFDKGTLTWRSTYDANGNLETFTDAKGQKTISVYGILNRLDSRTYSNHALPRAYPSIEAQSFTYDENGNLTDIIETKRTDVSTMVQQHTGHTYDKLDRLESTTLPSNKLLSYSYYAGGERKSVTDPDLVSTNYKYDAQGRLSEATIPEGTTLFKYWPDSLPKTTELPNGLMEKRCYDAAGQLTHIVLAQGNVTETCEREGTLRSRFDYDYDSNGNRLSQRETRTRPDTGMLEAPETTTYGYDDLDRLTGVAYPDGRAVLYHLDLVGNRTGERDAPSSAVSSLGPEAFDSVSADQLSRDTSGTFNRADWLMHLADQVDSSRERQLSYDANGNLSSLISPARTRSFAWDIRNTLATVRDNGQETGKYDYDIKLQRIRRHTTSESVEYALDNGFVLQEQDFSRQTKRRYHYAQKALAVSDTSDTTSTIHFLTNDALGSASDATSSTGEVVSIRKYDAWGNLQAFMAPSADEFKLGYTGHQFDIETGLTYARARYYDPELGRFISRDPYEGKLNDAPSLHRYVYGNSSPLRFIDPTGFASLDELQPGPIDQLLIALGWQDAPADLLKAQPIFHSEEDALRARPQAKLAEYTTVEDRTDAGAMTTAERNVKALPTPLIDFKGEYELFDEEQKRRSQVQLQGTALVAGTALSIAAPFAAPLIVETAGVTALGAGGLVFAGNSAGNIATEYGLTGEVTPEGAALSIALAGFSGLQSAKQLRPIERMAAAQAEFLAEDAARFGRTSQLSIQTSFIEPIPEAPLPKLTARQAKLLAQISSPGESVLVRKSDVNLTDLSALTNYSKAEFGMFTLGGRRMVFRGTPGNLGISSEKIHELALDGWRFSGHTHPGVTNTVLNASPDDRNVLRLFNEMGTQKRSAILNSQGKLRTFSSSIFDDTFGF